MTRGRRTAWLGAAIGMFVAWSIAQLVLTHRSSVAAHRLDLAGYHRFVERYGVVNVRPPQPVPTRAWLVPGLSGIVAALALAVVAALLVRGGRRWWAAVVVAAPAANAYRGWEDGRPLGSGWMQL